MQFSIQPRRTAVMLSLIALVLALTGIALTAYEWHLGVNNTYVVYHATQIFSLTHEGNIPTWYSSLLLFGVAVLSFVIARSTEKPAWGWWGLALLFLYLTLDEAAAIHETFTGPMRRAFDLDGYLHFGWVVVGVPFVLVMAAVFIPFVLRLPRYTQRTITAAAVVYLGGALGIEMISANLWSLNDGTSLLYSAVGTVEELCEMLGAIIMIYGLLHYIQRHIGTVTLVFGKPPA